jgi:hypothetical protein
LLSPPDYLAGASAIWWDTLEHWLTGHPELAEWAVAAGTTILAIATFALALQASREGSQVARQVDLQQQQLAASQRAIVYPVATSEWQDRGLSGQGIILKNGGSGPAFAVEGQVIFADGSTRRIPEVTLGVGDDQLCRLGPPLPTWTGASGMLHYTELTGKAREATFRFEEEAGRLFVKVEQT